MHASLATTWLAARLRHHERGANLVEYMLLLGFIAIVVLVAIYFVGQVLQGGYEGAGSTLVEHLE